MAAAQRRFSITAAEGILFQGLALCLGLAWVFLLARLLDVRSAGFVMLGMGVASSVVSILSLGLPQAFAVHARSLGDRVLVSNALAAALGMAIVATAVTLVLEYFVLTSLHGAFGRYPVLSALVFAQFLAIMFGSALRSVARFHAANLGGALPNILFCGLLAVFSLLHQRFSPAAVLQGYVIANGCGALFLLVALLRGSGFARVDVDLAHMKTMFAFGGNVQLGSVFKEVMYRADLYLVGLMLGAVSAGFYGLLLRVIEAVGRFVDALGLVILPLIARGTEHERREITYLSLSFILPFMLMFAIFTNIFADQMVSMMFGYRYAPVAPLLRVGIWALIPLTIWKILANDLIARGYLARYIVSTVSGAALIVALNLILLPVIGLQAAPFVLCMSYLAPALVLLTFMVSTMHYDPRRLFVFSVRSLSTRYGRSA
jgi:O-antigen/teichoic acid export membrane protein